MKMTELNSTVSPWESIDETCSKCGSITKHARGINKQNLKKLFFSWNWNEVIILVILILVIVQVWYDYQKLSEARDIIQNGCRYQVINNGQVTEYRLPLLNENETNATWNPIINSSSNSRS